MSTMYVLQYTNVNRTDDEGHAVACFYDLASAEAYKGECREWVLNEEAEREYLYYHIDEVKVIDSPNSKKRPRNTVYRYWSPWDGETMYTYLVVDEVAMTYYLLITYREQAWGDSVIIDVKSSSAILGIADSLKWNGYTKSKLKKDKEEDL